MTEANTTDAASEDGAVSKPMEPKDVFKFVLDTRNFEITNFWQRSNYFLVLNTGLAIGFFNLKSDSGGYRLLAAILGVVVCLLWNRVALGSKFWQVHWEGKLAQVEKMCIDQGVLDGRLGLFSQTMDDVKKEVRDALQSESHHSLIAKIIDKQVAKKPSVTQTMITLSSVFSLTWVGIAVPIAWKLWV